MLISRNRRGAGALFVLLLCVAAPTRLLAQHEGHEHNMPTANAERADITGTVLCSDGPPLPGAVIQLLAAGTVKASTIADEGGRFRISRSAQATQLRVTYLGHSTFTRELDPADGVGTVNIGVVRMEISAVELEALVASAERDRMQLRSGAVIVDTKKTAASAGGAVAEVLQTVPGIAITADGKVLIRGMPATILVNGSRAPLSGDALVAFLRQMPASALQKIEVATTPSISQDGAAGVVNLVFAGQAEARTNAYTGAIAVATPTRIMTSLAAEGRSLGIADWSVAYAFSSMRPQTDSKTFRENFSSASLYRSSEQESRADAKHALHTLNGALTWHANSSASLRARAGYSWMQGRFDNTTLFQDQPFGNVSSVSSTTVSTLRHTIPDLNGGVTFSMASLGSRNLKWKLDAATDRGTEDFVGNYAHPAGEFMRTAMTSRRTDSWVSNDLSLDLAGTRIGIGQLERWRRVDAKYKVTSGTLEDSRFDFYERIDAGYVSASRVMTDKYVEAGIRFESGAPVLPTLIMHWPHSADSQQQFQFSYARRIVRPEASQLNPYSMGEDDMNSFIGSPSLKPERLDQVEIGITRRTAFGSFAVTPFMRRTNLPIRPLKAISQSGRSTTTLQNLRSATAAGIDAAIIATLNERLRVAGTGSLYRLHTVGNAVDRAGLYADGRVTVDWRATSRSSVQLYAFRRGAEPVEQGRILSVFNSDIAISRTLSGNGLVTVRVSDPFNSNRLAFHLEDASFLQHSERRVTSRALSVFYSLSVGGRPLNDSEHHEEKARIF